MFKTSILTPHTERIPLKRVYTIGYEGRTFEDFLDVLNEHGISAVADVRANPYSKRTEFSYEFLKEKLENEGFRYYSFKKLGTPRKLREAFKSGKISRHAFKMKFLEHLSRNFQALEKLEKIANDVPTVLMCYERNPRKCHRSIIAEILEGREFRVIHL